MRVPFVSMVCLIAIVGTGLAEDYFPLQIGNTWTYERWLKDEEGWKPTGKTYLVSVVDTASVEGKTYFKLVNYRRLMPDGWNLASDTLLVRKSGDKVLKYTSPAPAYGDPWKENLLYHFFDPSSVKVLEPYYVLRLCCVHNGLPQEYRTNIFPLGYESVTVPAGAFYSYLIEVDGGWGFSFVEGEWYEWFAPGVGLVQVRDDTGLRPEGVPASYIRLNRALVNGISYPDTSTAIKETNWGEVKAHYK